MTLKDIIDSVLLESGMDTATVYATAATDAEKRMLNIANRAAVSLTKYAWQALRRNYRITLTTATTYSLPPDFVEWIPDSTYVTSTVDLVDIATTPREWGYLQAIGGTTGPVYKFRIFQGYIEVFGPNAGDEVKFDYLSNNWAQTPSEDSEGRTSYTYANRFTTDDDLFVLDDDLLIMEMIWRYKKLLGLPDWQVDLQDCRRYESYLRGQEKGAKTIVGNTPDASFEDPYTPLWVNN